MGNTAAMNLQHRPSNNLPEETIEQKPVQNEPEMNLNSILKFQNTAFVLWGEETAENLWYPWPEPVFYKLFLDPEGRNAALSAAKIEIWSRNFFSEEISTIFRAKYVGGRRDKPGNMFLFDLMKSNWEQVAIENGNMEINIDIVLSHAPLMRTCITLGMISDFSFRCDRKLILPRWRCRPIKFNN